MERQCQLSVSSRRDPHIFNDKNISARFFTIESVFQIEWKMNKGRMMVSLKSNITNSERIETFNKI